MTFPATEFLGTSVGIKTTPKSDGFLSLVAPASACMPLRVNAKKGCCLAQPPAKVWALGPRVPGGKARGLPSQRCAVRVGEEWSWRREGGGGGGDSECACAQMSPARDWGNGKVAAAAEAAAEGCWGSHPLPARAAATSSCEVKAPARIGGSPNRIVSILCSASWGAGCLVSV